MYDGMERSAVRSLRKRGLSYRKIAEQLQCDKKTVIRILQTPVDQRYRREPLGSQVDRFREQILEWLRKEVPIVRMLELVREDREPYTGSRSVFFRRVKMLREEWELERVDKFVRFEGLPGEYAQMDWGEVRNFPFVREEGAVRYFFAARLKFSRFVFVRFTQDMKLETLIRSMLMAFHAFGGVPWICVFDNMKTVVLGRDDKGRPIWQKTFFKFMNEVDAHPEACWKQSGNQKGAVENLVGWVKSNFLPERTFMDDGDLARQEQEWMDRVNGSVSQAHSQIPRVVLEEEERRKLTPLRTNAMDYGLFSTVEAGPDCLVHIDTNRYSVPEGYAGLPLTARLRARFIDFYAEDKLVAHYGRRPPGERRPIRIPEHFEATLRKKPRARVMLYRDHLMEQDPSVAAYIAELCRRQRGTFGPHMVKLYELWRAHGSGELGVACALASEHGAYGADYIASLLEAPSAVDVVEALALTGVPTQEDVDRSLAVYEDYVIGGADGDGL